MLNFYINVNLLIGSVLINKLHINFFKLLSKFDDIGVNLFLEQLSVISDVFVSVRVILSSHSNFPLFFRDLKAPDTSVDVFLNSGMVESDPFEGYKVRCNLFRC